MALLMSLCMAFAAAGCGTQSGGSASSDAVDRGSAVGMQVDNKGNVTADYSTVLDKYRELINSPSYFDEMDEKAWQNAEANGGEDAYFDEFEVEFEKLTGVPYLWIDCPVSEALIKYAYYDINKDGVDELLLTAGRESDNKIEQILGIMTMIDGKPATVCSGWARNSCTITNDGQIINYGSGGADYSGLFTFVLENGKLTTIDILYVWGGNYINVPDGRYDANKLDEAAMDSISGLSEFRISESEFDRLYDEKMQKIITVEGKILDTDAEDPADNSSAAGEASDNDKNADQASGNENAGSNVYQSAVSGDISDKETTGENDPNVSGVKNLNAPEIVLKEASDPEYDSIIWHWNPVDNANGYEYKYTLITEGKSDVQGSGNTAEMYAYVPCACDAIKFSVRAFANVNGKKVYSDWSNDEMDYEEIAFVW